MLPAIWFAAGAASWDIAGGLFGPQSPVMYPRVSRPGAYPTFQRIGTSAPIVPYAVQNYMAASKWSLDNDAGDVTGTADANLVNPLHIADALLRKWGNGVAATDMLTTTQFGSFRDAADALVLWASEFESSEVWQNNIVIADQTTIGNVIATICAQAPIFVAKTDAGKYYAGIYPHDEDEADHNYYKDSDGNRVKIHPNLRHPSASDFGKPYAVDSFSCGLTPAEEVFNRFSINYRPFLPTGRLLSRQVLTEVDADCRLYSGSLDFEGFPTNDASDVETDSGMSYNFADICIASQARYGARTMPDINAPYIYEHMDATGFLYYLLKRYTNQRIVFGARGGVEFYDLKPGHIIQVSNDMNLVQPRPDYMNAPAKEVGWNDTASTGAADYLVTRRRSLPASGNYQVEFYAEQIIYTPV